MSAANVGKADPSSLPTTISEILDNTFAYGIDWTEYKDKSEHDHEASTYAGKIKEELKESLTQALLAAFEKHLQERIIEEIEMLEYVDWASQIQEVTKYDDSINDLIDSYITAYIKDRTQLIKENKENV